MNSTKLITALCAAGLVSFSSVQAEEKIAPKTLEFLESTTISGYVETSYTFNTRGSSAFDYTGVVGNPLVGGGAFKQNVNSFNIDAFKLVLEKPLDESEYSAGYRVDILAGQTANLLGSDGVFGDSGFTLEQAYVAFRAPVGNGLDFKLGKFVTLLGYEVIETPANFNVSRSALFSLIPFTHTGLLASYRINDMFDVQAGIVNGSDISVDNNDKKGAIARLGFTTPDGNGNLGLTYYYEDSEAHEAGPGHEDGTVQIIDLTATFSPMERLTLGGEVLYRDDQLDADAAGGALYAKYQLTDVFSIAGRGEYVNLQDDDITNDIIDDIVDDDDENAGDLVTATITLGFDIWKNLQTKVEYKHDWVDGADQDTFIFSAVYLY